MRLYDEFPIVPHIPGWSSALPVDPFKSVEIADVIEELSSSFTPLPREHCLQRFEIEGDTHRETYTVPLDNPLLENQHVVGYVLRNHSRVVKISISPIFGSGSRSNDYVGVFCTLDLQLGYATEENLRGLKSCLSGLYNPRNYEKKQK